MVAKGYTYLNKPASKSYRFIEVRMTFCYQQAVKD